MKQHDKMFESFSGNGFLSNEICLCPRLRTVLVLLLESSHYYVFHNMCNTSVENSKPCQFFTEVICQLFAGGLGNSESGYETSLFKNAGTATEDGAVNEDLCTLIQ